MNKFFQFLFSCLLMVGISTPLIAQSGEFDFAKTKTDYLSKITNGAISSSQFGEAQSRKELKRIAKDLGLLRERQVNPRITSGERAVPANDDCDDAISISCGDNITGNTDDADLDPVVDEYIDEEETQGVWYKYYGNGQTVTLTSNPATTDYDNRITVFEGSCGSLNYVGTNDDAYDGDLTDHLSEATFISESGKTYYILVHGYSEGDYGYFDIDVSCGKFCDITMMEVDDVDCNGDGSYDLELDVYGQYFPLNGNFKLFIGGQSVEVEVTNEGPDYDDENIFDLEYFDDGETEIELYDLTIFGEDMDIFFQANNGCTWTIQNDFDSPDCGAPEQCDITNMALRSANPTPCNGDGTHDLKIKLFGPGLPATAGDAKVVIDGTEYPIANWNKQGNGTVNIRINNVDPSGNMPNVFVQAEGGCTFYIQDMYTKPSCNTRLAGDLGSAFIYPNPTIGTFTISGKNFSKASYKIVNTMGQVVVKGTISNYNDELVDLSRFDKGLYIVTVTEGANVMTERIIKQ